MIELDFLVPAQVMVGNGAFGGGSPVDVTVTAASTVWPDHNDYVSVSLGRGKVILQSNARVIRSERGITIALQEMGVQVGIILDRELARTRRVLKDLTDSNPV